MNKVTLEWLGKQGGEWFWREFASLAEAIAYADQYLEHYSIYNADGWEIDRAGQRTGCEWRFVK